LKYFACTDTGTRVEGLKRRLKLAEGHVEAGRLLGFYQVCILYCTDFDDLSWALNSLSFS
jgi:hypothetical protein